MTLNSNFLWSSHRLCICGIYRYNRYNGFYLLKEYFPKVSVLRVSSEKIFLSCMMFGQNRQKRWSRSIPKCLPFSIINKWLESLNLVSAVRSLTWISSRYFSNPGSSLNLPYVLNLLSLRFIFSKACWWKISESLWNVCRCKSISLSINDCLNPICDTVFLIFCGLLQMHRTL